MGISIIVGGQYGSEGKGKACKYFTEKLKAKAVVRVGGTNSGHTSYCNNQKMTFRMLSSACLLDEVVTILPAGSYIDIDVLLAEITETNIDESKLKIDPNAVIITSREWAAEKELGLKSSIGSTLSGTGYTYAKRIMRGILGDVIFAKDIPQLSMYLCDTKDYMYGLLQIGENIIIEGTQGYGLSNIHTENYPYCTGRDTTAAGFLSETGLSPLSVDNVIMVIRSYPIRVAGNSGPLKNEISWKEVAKAAGTNIDITEKTTVTKNIRRVGTFDKELVISAIKANNPNIIVLNHVDYFDYSCTNKPVLSEKQLTNIKNIESQIKRKINYIGNGPNTFIEM